MISPKSIIVVLVAVATLAPPAAAEYYFYCVGDVRRYTCADGDDVNARCDQCVPDDEGYLICDDPPIGDCSAVDREVAEEGYRYVGSSGDCPTPYPMSFPDGRFYYWSECEYNYQVYCLGDRTRWTCAAKDDLIGEVCKYNAVVNGRFQEERVPIPDCDTEAAAYVGNGFRLAQTRNNCPSQIPLRREGNNEVYYVWEECL